jgi:GNAT superfamily N-acetyltransferase
MSDDIILRPPAPEEFERWLKLWDGYNAFYGRSGPTALPADITRITWQRFFDPASPVHACIAVRGGHFLGLVHYLYHLSTTAQGPSCYLQDLFTVEEARGQGIGSALIRHVYAEAKRAGASCVYWQTHETNGTARRLYDTLSAHSGFLVYETCLDAD